tara:strand:- start:172 stop:924 length:753 start_codon:yes stop_codon:yes gene_type:complete
VSLLQTIELNKSFGENHVINDVNFSVTEGEVMALVGPNGAGKTSLVNLLSAYLSPDHGKILFQGQDITPLSVSERIQAGIARSFQIANLFDELSALDNVALSISARSGKTYTFLSLAEHDNEVQYEAVNILELFGLKSKSDIPTKELAQGERKLLDVAVAYALKPKFLFLDEPTSGVSTRDKAQIMDTISYAVRNEGVTAAIIEHDMDIVFKYSDRIVVMADGRIIADGPPENIREDKEVISVIMGSERH